MLDVGTGTGALLRELAGRGVRPAEVVGIDLSAKMLERARSAGLAEHWRLERADARALPFEDERFDVVFAAYVLNVLSEADALAVLREIRRVLAARGRVAVVTPVEPRSALGRPYRSLAEALPRLLPRWFAGIRLLDPGPLVRAAGLRPERERYVARGYPSVCLLAAR